MAETSPAATSAFAASRDLVQGIAERFDALGPGTQALIDALVERLDTLPLAASFDPFAAVAASPAAVRRGSAAKAGRPKRRPAATTTPAPPSFGALGEAIAGALGSATPPQVMSLAEALAGGLSNGRSGSASAPAASTAARRAAGRAPGAAPAATSGAGLLAVPAQAAEQVAQWLSQWVVDAAAVSQPAGAQAAGGSAIGAALAGQPLFAQQILDALAALGPQPARARRAAPAAAPAKTSAAERDEAIQLGSDSARSSTPASPPGEIAPRAGSRLLPPAAAAQNIPPEGKAAPIETESVADDPIDAMTRALIDQAWLRGVDLR